jgi:hypothetical protein
MLAVTLNLWVTELDLGVSSDALVIVPFVLLAAYLAAGMVVSGLRGGENSVRELVVVPLLWPVYAWGSLVRYLGI